MRALISRSAARLDMNASLAWRAAHVRINTQIFSQADSSVSRERDTASSGQIDLNVLQKSAQLQDSGIKILDQTTGKTEIMPNAILQDFHFI